MSAKLKLGIATVVLILLCALLTEGVIVPTQIQGDVLRLRLLSLTPSDSGLQATFELHNENGPKVDVWPAAELSVRDPAEEHYYVAVTPVTMVKGDKVDIAVKVPSDGEWQVGFRVAKHRAKKGTIVLSAWIGSKQTAAGWSSVK